jgi:hypothetical protein
MSSAAVVTPLALLREESEKIERFEEGGLLTAKQLNALVDRVNELEAR